MTAERSRKIGIGVVTCNRVQLFRECISGIPEADEIVVVNDGSPYPSTIYPTRVAFVIQHKTNKGVGRSKNDALRYLLQAGCTDIFLCEDDIKIDHPDLCHEYIRASECSGILHFNFAYHGFENKSEGLPLPPREVKHYDGNVSIGFHKNLLGAFSYYRREVLELCGLMDPLYKNMLEHVDHTYRIIKAGFHPPFWWFADLHESYRYIKDLDPYHANSTSRPRRAPTSFISKLSHLYFMIRNGRRVWMIPDTGPEELEQALLILKQKYGSPKNR